MPYTIAYNTAAHIIELSFQGGITVSDAREMVNDVLELATKHKCSLLLNDFRDAEISASTVEIYEFPLTVAEGFVSAGGNPAGFKRALVVAKGLEDFHFFETVSINRGQDVKLFNNLDEARKWLLNR